MGIIAEVFKYYHMGFSARKIAKLTGLSKNTVCRIINAEKSKSQKGRKKQALPFIPKQLKEKIKIMLEHKTEEKGKTRNISFYKIYETLELEFKQIGITNKQKYYDFIRKFIIAEYGSEEALKAKRTDKKQINQIRANKGHIKRQKSIVEIDATGYTYKGKRYAVLQAMDQQSGYMLDFMIIQLKDEKEAPHYNKAFNQMDFMFFLYNLYTKYGASQGIKVDNEKFLIGQNVERALNEIGTKLIKAKPYNPREKLIERAFRTVKEELRVLTAFSDAEFEDMWEAAIDKYNKTKHKFITGSWIPAEKFQTYEYIDEDTLRESFAYEEERTWINGYIRFDNKTYFFNHPELEVVKQSLGRKKQNPKVKIRIDLENNTKAFVYTEKGEYLGVATLITTVEETSLIEEKQQKQKSKRINKTKKKLQQKLNQLNNIEEKEETNNLNAFEEILKVSQTKPVEPEDLPELPEPNEDKEQTEELIDIPDPLNLFGE